MDTTMAHMRLGIMKSGSNETLIFIGEDGNKYDFATGKRIHGRLHRVASRDDLKNQPGWMLETLAVNAMKYWHAVIKKRADKAAKEKVAC